MRIAIVDDQLNDIRQTTVAFEKCLPRAGIPHSEIDLFHSGEEFLNSFRPGQYNLILLDILMNTLTGIDTARLIRENDISAAIAFVSASNSYASQSYEVKASYYLQQPLKEEEVLSMLNQLDLDSIQNSRYIELPDKTQLFLSNILYTEKFKHYTIFHTHTGDPQQVRLTQKVAEDMLLPHPEFFTVSQGVIVNFSHVASISGEVFHMNNEHIIPIPRRRFKELKEMYSKYCFEQSIKEDSF